MCEQIVGIGIIGGMVQDVGKIFRVERVVLLRQEVAQRINARWLQFLDGHG